MDSSEVIAGRFELLGVLGRGAMGEVRRARDLETGDTVELKPFKKWSPKGTWTQFGIAAQLEGTLKTAFPAGDKLGVDAPEKSAKTSRAAWRISCLRVALSGLRRLSAASV